MNRTRILLRGALPVVLLAWVFSFPLPKNIQACTLFGAAGSAVEGGGVLVGKTRDLPAEAEQILIRETTASGYAYLGIASKKNSRITAGGNEKGLVILNASASSVAPRPRSHLPIENVLGRAASVEEALIIFREEGMRSPIHYLLADPRHLALLEVFNAERFETQKASDGILVHTNHYIFPSLSGLNGKAGKSSAARLSRIQYLMNGPPFTASQFLSFAQDHLNGPGDLSICRHRSPPARSSGITVSAIVFLLQRGKPPQIWYRLGQPCEGPFKKAFF